MSPQIGDRLAISVYYDQHGHNYFTAADLTQHTTQTVRLRAKESARSLTTPRWR